MNSLVLYGSSHGTTKNIVKNLGKFFSFKFDVFNVKGLDPIVLLQYDLIIFFSPTYGDEELQIDVEDFLQQIDFSLHGKLIVVIELGNYYGYEKQCFGARKILTNILTIRGAKEFYPGFSLDSLPRIDWNTFSRWADGLSERVRNV